MTTEPSEISKQEIKWRTFAESVVKHIRNYVIPQWGDEGDEPAKEYDLDDCIKQARRYLERFGKSQRPGEEFRDLCKSAHWISKAAERLQRKGDAA